MSEKIETKEEIILANEDVKDNSDIFVQETDLFDCSVRYYKGENGLVVEGVSDNFDPSFNNIKSFNFSCKYPSLAEVESILTVISFKEGKQDGLQGTDYLFLQIIRLKLLLKKWDSPFSVKDLEKVDSVMLSGMLNAVNKEIGYKGLIL